MLTTLRIQHFAIVKELELDLQQGMTAFTGETGAGKSIMIDALLLALGARADASVIRPGEELCDITAGFTFDAHSEPAQWLAAHDIPYEDNELYLRRVIHVEGRSKSYINGHPFPLQKVKELSERLVHIHGQHQHQTLMQHPTHRQQLDQYSHHPELLKAVAQTYKQYQALKEDITRLEQQDLQADKVQLLHFQIEELSALNVQEGELERLHQEHQLLHHAKEYIDYSQQISVLLNGDDAPNICSGLHQVLHLLHALPQEQPSIMSTTELLNSALIQCEEAFAEMEDFTEHVSLDPERLAMVEERMSAIHHLARKYHVDGHQLLEHTQSLMAELATLQKNKTILEQHYKQLAAVAEQYQDAAHRLRDSRQQHAKKLAQELSHSIQQLGMPQGWIEIEISPLDKMHSHGQDKVEYKVCTNPGMLPDSLNKIASGGELSRISLAIQMITAQKGATPTLLFDEVDVGIGGATAALVGSMLRKLGERLQVFCVTHQAQVAASAHHHFMVKKYSEQQQTFTQITALDNADKIDEIARMLGGLSVTEQSKSHAKELLCHLEG